MLPKHTLQRLIESARTVSDKAARTLGATHAREREEVSRLDLLIRYREEYLVRFGHTAGAGIDRDLWLNYRQFVAKLDAAIARQQEVIAEQQRHVERRRSEWRAANGRLRSFDVLEERRRSAEALAGRRREQRKQDEFALRAIRTAR